MNNGFLIIMLIIAILALSGRIQGLSGLLIFGLILFFLGWFTIKFFWIILAIVGINYITKNMRPKTQRRTQYTYRTYTQQDFEDFFRRATGNQYGGQYQGNYSRSEEHTSELQSRQYLVCRLLLEKKHLYPNRPHL